MHLLSEHETSTRQSTPFRNIGEGSFSCVMRGTPLPSRQPTSVAVDDVVVIHAKDQPRVFWKLGCAKDVLVGRDGQIRGATVQVSGKGCQTTLLQRPIQLLYPLQISKPYHESGMDADNAEMVSFSDLQQGVATQDSMQVVVQDDEQDSEGPLPCSRRAAAQEAQDKLLAQALTQN